MDSPYHVSTVTPSGTRTRSGPPVAESSEIVAPDFSVPPGTRKSVPPVTRKLDGPPPSYDRDTPGPEPPTPSAEDRTSPAPESSESPPPQDQESGTSPLPGASIARGARTARGPRTVFTALVLGVTPVHPLDELGRQGRTPGRRDGPLDSRAQYGVQGDGGRGQSARVSRVGGAAEAFLRLFGQSLGRGGLPRAQMRVDQHGAGFLLPQQAPDLQGWDRRLDDRAAGLRAVGERLRHRGSLPLLVRGPGRHGGCSRERVLPALTRRRDWHGVSADSRSVRRGQFPCGVVRIAARAPR